MSSVPVIAMPLLTCLALGLTAGAAYAQSPPAATPPTAFLYVGADENQDNRGAGAATVTAFGTTALSGQYAFIEADTATTAFKGLSAFGTGQITVTGGTFQQLLADDSSVINLIGHNFTQSSEYQIDPFGLPYYTITGTLQQETLPFTAEWYAPSTGQLQFDGLPAIPGGSPVPEASTTISLGLLLVLGAGWLMVRRRAAA